MDEREQRAAEFADWHGREIEAWMLWDGWVDWVGCEACATIGPGAPCWGEARCHGYHQGCGCRDCASLDGGAEDGWD